MIDLHGIGIISLVAGSIFAVGVSVETLTPIGPTQMSLKRLVYEDGHFKQEHFVSGEGTLVAKWSAEINRGNEHLCSGSGEAPYQNENLKVFTINDWVGDDCPELQSGDVGFAVWEYIDDQNTRHRISGEVTIAEMFE